MIKLLKTLSIISRNANAIKAWAGGQDLNEWQRANASNLKWHKTYYPEHYGVKRDQN